MYINKIGLDFGLWTVTHNKNIKQKGKIPLASTVKKYFLKVHNGMVRLLRENNSENIEFTSEVFDITEIYMKNKYRYCGSWHS